MNYDSKLGEWFKQLEKQKEDMGGRHDSWRIRMPHQLDGWQILAAATPYQFLA